MSLNKSLDLSVFNNNEDNDNHNQHCNVFTSCQCIERILTALRYYQLLDLKSNEERQEIFNNFINTVYSPSDLIMDYFHLQQMHDNKIQNIRVYALDHYEFP